MTVADYIVKFLSDRGVSTIFMITGGHAMFLNDAVYRNRKITPVFNHHEQACGMAAEAYGRISGKLGVAMVTAGPGAINVLSGVVGAFADSSPMMVISGQSALQTVSYMQKAKIRQFGLQGIDIAPMARAVSKYFVTVDDPAKIESYLEEAYFWATNERRGPVWLEIPLDVQRMEVPKRILLKFERPKVRKWDVSNVSLALDLLYKSRRPLLLAGQGLRGADAQQEFLKVLKKLNIPVVTTRLGIDLVESDNPLFVGRPGLYPDRASNFAIQNADLIIAVGARLDTGIVGYDARDWGRHAKKIVVDIDREELNKPGINIDLAIRADVKNFLRELLLRIDERKLPEVSNWISVCQNWRQKYPMVLANYKKERLVNSYYLCERLSEFAGENDVVVVDTSSVFHVACETWKIKAGQRFLTTGGISTMGYWVAAIGACMAAGRRRTIVITGDGSLQMNIQELATIVCNKLPIKIFIVNNKGYLLIRHTQKTHMEGRYMGESPKTGVWCPDSLKIAKAYGILGIGINSTLELDKKIKRVLSEPGPVICDIKSPQWQLVMPRISSTRQADGSMVSRPYEDLFPFLDPEELKSNMIEDIKEDEKA